MKAARKVDPSPRSNSRKREPAPAAIEVTNANKVWFPEDKITKGEVFDYYAAVAERLLPFLHDRPMTLERLPEGIGEGKPHFWQKHTPAYYPVVGAASEFCHGAWQAG